MLHSATSTRPLRRVIEHAPIVAGVRGDDSWQRVEPLPRTRARDAMGPARRTTQPQEAARPQRSRLRVLLLATGGLLLAVAAGALTLKLLDPATLPIASVRIEGQFTHVTARELEHTLANVARGNFISVNVDAIRKAAQTLPWVNTVTVHRVWPDTLRIKVSEQVAVANWGEVGAEQDSGLLNNSGKLFTPARTTFPDGLPEIRGPRGTHGTLLAHYHAMSQTLVPLGLHVQRLTQDERRAFHLTLDNGITLVLGRADSYARLMRFVHVWPSLQARESQLALIDLRYSNGFAVRWGRQESNAKAEVTGGKS